MFNVGLFNIKFVRNLKKIKVTRKAFKTFTSGNATSEARTCGEVKDHHNRLRQACLISSGLNHWAAVPVGSQRLNPGRIE